MPATETELKQFRAEKDHVFAHDPGSPIPADQRGSFKGLLYFDENPDLVITARVDRNVEAGEVRMSSTGGEEQVYRRYGAVNFEVDGQPARLMLYLTRWANPSGGLDVAPSPYQSPRSSSASPHCLSSWGSAIKKDRTLRSCRRSCRRPMRHMRPPSRASVFHLHSQRPTTRG